MKHFSLLLIAIPALLLTLAACGGTEEKETGIEASPCTGRCGIVAGVVCGNCIYGFICTAEQYCVEIAGNDVDYYQPDTQLTEDDAATPDSVQEDNDIPVITWTEYAGLQWSEKSEKQLSGKEAMDWCASLGGRMPSISELRTIIINCPNTMTGGACKVYDNTTEFGFWNESDCRCDGSAESYSALGDDKATWLWSSSSRVMGTSGPWCVDFSCGGISLGSPMYVRCVRQ